MRRLATNELGSLFCAGLVAACGLDANGELASPGGADAQAKDGGGPPPALTSDASMIDPAAPDGGTPNVIAPPPMDAAPDPETGVDAANGASSPFCDPTDPSLLLCVRFENEVRDESPHPLAPTSALVTYAPGVRGQAAVFTPPADGIVFPNDARWNVPKVTIEGWVRPASLPNKNARAGILDSDGRYGVFVYGPGTIDCLVQNVHLVGPALVTNQWTHVACTYDGATVTLYVGGTSRASAPLAAAGSSVGTTAIGQNSPSGDPFDGAIDELRVFSLARTAAQVAAAATP